MQENVDKIEKPKAPLNGNVRFQKNVTNRGIINYEIDELREKIAVLEKEIRDLKKWMFLSYLLN